VTAPVITTQNLVKSYAVKGSKAAGGPKVVVAVDGISFEVGPGESFGLLGPNGAGKSTAMRMIGAVSTRTSGDLRVLGLDPNRYGPEIRAQLGVVPQENNLDTELRVRENLLVYGRYFGLPRAQVARRADDRPRPTGASHSLGPPFPAQGAGHYPARHDPLHGRSRTAL
jgi:lipooligosaccharide transport system ATP-binding protein